MKLKLVARVMILKYIDWLLLAKGSAANISYTCSGRVQVQQYLITIYRNEGGGLVQMCNTFDCHCKRRKK